MAYNPFRIGYHCSNKVISTFYYTVWWLCCCSLCILNNPNGIIVNGAYSEADDLINELDRPSK